MRALVLEHTELNRATVFIDVLRARGFETVVVELDRGDELADWRQFDIVVAMGGPQSAFEEVAYPWLVEEKQLIREVIDAGRPYFGVCLGSQLLAASLGGRVYRGLEPEVGLHPVVLTEDAARDPVFAGFPREISVLEFHQDHFELPPGAVRTRYAWFGYRDEPASLVINGRDFRTLMHELPAISTRIVETLVRRLVATGAGPR